MRRGELMARPAGLVWVDWRIGFERRTGWFWDRVWRFASFVGWSRGMAACVRAKPQHSDWMIRVSESFTAHHLVVGTDALRDAVAYVLERDKVWSGGIQRFDSWDTCALAARTSVSIVEVVIAPDGRVPLLQGVKARPYTGFSHTPGSWYE